MSLKILYPADGVVPQKPLKVDVVAVHGLNGNPVEAWTHKKSKAFWIKDFLPIDVPEARVLSYGYNASTLGDTTAKIRDHGRDLVQILLDNRKNEDEVSRPIIFIGHSLGGIIIKQALVTARTEDKRYRPIKDLTIGIVFFGTPHRGSELATYGKVLADIASTLKGRTKSRLIRALKTNSDELFGLTQQFRFLPQYQIVSFYEMKPMSVGIVVEQHSTLLEVVNEEQIGVDANHRDICRFESSQDAIYRRLVARIQDMLTAGDHQLEPLNKHYYVPHHLSPVFTGRVDVCEELVQKCLPPKTHQKSVGQKVYVLYGLGGSGKTQVAVKFAEGNLEKFWGVFWIDASSKETAEQGFKQLSKDVFGVEEDLRATRMRLSNTRDPWLLIIDNADDPNMDVSVYFPTGGRGTILLTTRNPDCKVYATVGWHEFGAMAAEDAITLLLRSAAIKNVSDPDERAKARQLVELLSCLALAIIQAGAVIRQKLYTIEEYCDEYVRRSQELLSKRPVQASSDYAYSVYTTWEVSIDMIQRRTDAETAENALEFLHVFSFLHFDDISEDIFKRAWTNMRVYKASEWVVSRQIGLLRNRSERWDREMQRKAIVLLSSFSLITIGTKLHISMHPLVHVWARARLIDEEKIRFSTAAVCTLGFSLSSGEETPEYQFRKYLLPHIDSYLNTCGDTYVAVIPEKELLRIENNFQRAYYDNGQFRKALQHQERLLEACKKTLGEEHPETVAALGNLSQGYQAVGKTQDALRFGEIALVATKNAFGEKHRKTLMLMNNLSSIYCDCGRFEEAMELQKDVLEARRTILGEEHMDTLTSQNNLAEYYTHLGRIQEAAELQEPLLEVRKRTLGAEHPHTFASMGNLATSYRRLGRTEEAVSLGKEVLEVELKALGKDHPATLSSMSLLSACYGDMGQHEKALELEKEVMEARINQLGENHPHTLASMDNVVFIYDDMDRSREAAELGEKVLEVRMKTIGESHPDTLTTMSNLATSYRKLGRGQEAVELAEKTMGARKIVLGGEHPDTLTSMNNLAVNYVKIGKLQEAVELQAKVVELSKRLFGDENKNTRAYLLVYQQILRTAKPPRTSLNPKNWLQVRK